MKQLELNQLDTAVSSVLQRPETALPLRLKLIKVDAGIKRALKSRHDRENQLKKEMDETLHGLRNEHERACAAIIADVATKLAALLEDEADLVLPEKLTLEDLNSIPPEIIAAAPIVTTLLDP